MAARSIQSGLGVQIIDTNGNLAPLTQFAPLYAVLLSAAGTVHAPLEQAGRNLNIGIFAFSIVLIWRILRDASESSVAGIVACALFTLAPEILQIHSMIWSESCFLLFMLGFIWLLGRSMSSGGSWQMLILASLAAGLAAMTRYSGAAIVLGGTVALLVDPGRERTQRLLRAGLFAAAACIAPAAWFVRNLVITGNLANRSLGFHPPVRADLLDLASTISHWLVPHGPATRWDRAAAIVVLLIIGLVILATRSGQRQHRRLDGGAIAGILLFTYLAFILFSKTLVDAHTQLDQRILAPVWVCGLIVLATRIAGPSRSHDRVLVGAIVALALFGQGIRAGLWVREAPDLWLGYGSRQWGRSDLLRFVERLPEGTRIFSNADDLIYLRTGRFAKPLPKVVDPREGAERTGRYKRHLEKIRAELVAHGGYVVFFETVDRNYRVSGPRVRRNLSLRGAYRGVDGWVYEPTPQTAVPATAPTRPAAEDDT
jgi:hypothetical protein